MATRSVLSRAATADTQKGCSKPGSPRSPWASRCRASGRFLERPHRATELWAGSRVSKSLGAGQRATRQEGTKCAPATRSRQVRSLPQRPHPCKGATPAPDQGDFLCGKPRGRGGKQLLPVVCTRHHMLLVDELDAVDGAPEKGAVRGMAQPHPQPMLPPTLGTAGRLTGGHRRQAGTPQGSSTHARSRPGPRRSHSTPCSEHLVLPQRPGARSWSRGQRMGSPVNLNTRVCMPSPQAHSQRLHVGVLRHIPHLHRAVMGRAVELMGASAERQALGGSWKEGRRGPGLQQARQRSGLGRTS